MILTEATPDRLAYDSLGICLTTEDLKPFSAQLRLRLEREDVTGAEDCVSGTEFHMQPGTASRLIPFP